jgi:phosphatidylglycerophosphatase A
MKKIESAPPLLRLANIISTWFGCGRFPFAPGTVGSAAAIAIAIALHRWAGFPPPVFALMAALLFLPAVWAADVSARAAGLKDPGFVVVDEVVGQWITLAGARVLNWETFMAAFALFRILDIWKPAPARQLERLPGGLGINADDAMAGVYAALVLFAAGCFNLY